MRRTTIALLTAAVLLLGACSGDDEVEASATTAPGADTTSTTVVEGPAGDLAAARQRWAEAGIDDYVMTYQQLCFCPEIVVTVKVEDGELVDTDVAGDGASGGFTIEGQTVEDMFDEIGEAIDGGAASVEATYDPTDGHPERYFIDVNEMIVDEEHGNTVLELIPAGATSTSTSTTAPAPTVGATVTGGDLVDERGCFTTFQIGDPAETVALVITPSDAAAVVTGATGTIGDTTWSGEVLIGTDLFGNWCDDVMEPGEPTREVAETWPVVAGEIRVTAGAPDGCPGEAAIDLTGVVAVRPDGTSLDIGNLSITNDAYGCIPG